MFQFLTSISCLGWEKRLRETAVRLLRLKKGEIVLDVGCGPGTNFNYLRKEIGPQGKIVGLDLSPLMVAAARKRVQHQDWKNVELICQDTSTDFNLPKGTFQGAIAIFSFSVIPDYKTALERVLYTIQLNSRFVILDVRQFQGHLRFLNPLLEVVFVPTTCWKPRRNIVPAFRNMVNDFTLQEFLSGTYYVISGRKFS